MGPGQLRRYATDLDALAGALEAAAQVHGTAVTALGAGTEALDGAWNSPLATQVVAAARTAQRSLSAPPGALADAASACRGLAARARDIATEVQRLDAGLQTVERALATVGPDPDPGEHDRLRRERDQLRRRRQEALAGWSQACAATGPRLGAAAELVGDRAASAASAAAEVPRVPLALAGDGAAMPTGGALPGTDLPGLLSWAQRLTTLGTLHEMAWIHPALARVPDSFRREVLVVPEAARLRAFLRWQQEIGQRVPTPLAMNRLASEGLLPPGYLAAARDLPVAPNLSSGARATSGLRLAGRWLAPLGLATGPRQLVGAESHGDRVAAGAGVFAAGVGTWALVGVVAPPVAIAAGIAGVGALLYEGWRHREAIGAWVSDAWSWGTDVASAAWDGTTDAVVSAWDATTGAVSSAWDWGTDAASAAWSWGSDAASSAWDGLTGFASSAWRWGGDAIDRAAVQAADAWDWTTGSASAVADWTADTAGAVIDWTRDHSPGLLSGGRPLWWLQQASESVFGTATPLPTPFEQPELLAPIFDGLGVAPPSDPGAVAAIFADLDPVVARDLVATHPTVLGALDGVPTHLRHGANLELLTTERERLGRQLAAIDAQLAALGPLPPGDLDGRAAAARLRAERTTLLDTARDLLDLQQRLATGPSGHPRHLLLFDPERGRVAVSHGDVAEATHVTTLALGTGADLATVTGGLVDLARWTEAAEMVGADTRHAHVLWLGYEAPDDLLQAASASHAQRGAPAFSDFAAGVRAVNPDVHHVAGGHSYGSSLAGEAAATHGLDVDGLLLLASPGARASHVDDYQLPDHAVVTVATDTSWRPTGPDDRGGGDHIHLVSAGVLTSELGPDPASDRFGARRVDVGDAGGHGRADYLAAETRSLQALAEVSNGAGAQEAP